MEKYSSSTTLLDVRTAKIYKIDSKKQHCIARVFKNVFKMYT